MKSRGRLCIACDLQSVLSAASASIRGRPLPPTCVPASSPCAGATLVLGSAPAASSRSVPPRVPLVSQGQPSGSSPAIACDPGGAKGAMSFTSPTPSRPSRNATCNPGGASGTRFYPNEGGGLDGFCLRSNPDLPSSLAFPEESPEDDRQRPNLSLPSPQGLSDRWEPPPHILSSHKAPRKNYHTFTSRTSSSKRTVVAGSAHTVLKSCFHGSRSLIKNVARRTNAKKKKNKAKGSFLVFAHQ